jgi:hypothetical protein
MSKPQEILQLARESEANLEAEPTNWSLRRIRNVYVDTLALTLDIEFQKAYQMVLDLDFKLPKEKKNK